MTSNTRLLPLKAEGPHNRDRSLPSVDLESDVSRRFWLWTNHRTYGGWGKRYKEHVAANVNASYRSETFMFLRSCWRFEQNLRHWKNSSKTSMPGPHHVRLQNDIWWTHQSISVIYLHIYIYIYSPIYQYIILLYALLRWGFQTAARPWYFCSWH